jgi:uncharacterized membrane protein
VSGLAYLLLPISGVAAYMTGSSRRLRFHGLQAIALGLLWAGVLYACALVSPGATQVGFAVGAVVWVVVGIGAAAGRDPRLPVIGGWLFRLAEIAPDEES